MNHIDALLHSKQLVPRKKLEMVRECGCAIPRATGCFSGPVASSFITDLPSTKQDSNSLSPLSVSHGHGHEKLEASLSVDKEFTPNN